MMNDSRGLRSSRISKGQHAGAASTRKTNEALGYLNTKAGRLRFSYIEHW